MQLRELKKEYLQGLVKFGQTPSREKLRGGAGEDILPFIDKWERAFNKAQQPSFAASQPRLVNSFSLGADPEFVFEGMREGELEARVTRDAWGNDTLTHEPAAPRRTRINADSLNLKTGLFIGADQNGRLVEIRPRPSRSALAVVGSIMDSLRWLAILKPETLGYNWLSGAFIYDDGIGGHVHFGRKRPSRPSEVLALDAATKMMFELGIFPIDQQRLRTRGDARGQRYGVYGDFRLQMHGYEYRVPPSWLSDPWLAFFVLTISKLVVYNPRLVEYWRPERAKENLTNLLSYYKGFDDDAKLALWALEHKGFPKHKDGDFKEAWGCNFAALHEQPKISYYPSSIKPMKETLKQVFDFLAEGKKITPLEPVPTWKPLVEPEGVVLYDTVQNTRRQYAIGELMAGLCIPKDGVFRKMHVIGDEGNRLVITTHFNIEAVQKAVQKIAPGLSVHSTYYQEFPYIAIPMRWRKNGAKLKLIKKLLLSGVFPIWKVETVTPEMVKEWGAIKKTPKKKYRGMKLASLRSGL